MSLLDWVFVQSGIHNAVKSGVMIRIRIGQITLSNRFRFHPTSMISKYSNSRERKFILHIFVALLTVDTHDVKNMERKIRAELLLWFISTNLRS